MSITDELREWIKTHEYTDGFLDLRQWYVEPLTNIADHIDKAYDNIDTTHIALPKDKDGFVIRVGDLLQSDTIEPFTVRVRGIASDKFIVYERSGIGFKMDTGNALRFCHVNDTQEKIDTDAEALAGVGSLTREEAVQRVKALLYRQRNLGGAK